MAQKYEIRAEQTIDMIHQLLNRGIKKISVLMRHSERSFSEDARLEPFMGLTDAGKQLAVDFGAAIRPNLLPKLFSSIMGRCIETAYLIDKGFTKKNNQALEHNSIQEALSPFYINHMEKVLQQVGKIGNHAFLRNWFDNRIDESIMKNPEKTSDHLTGFMIEQIKNLKENQIALCISHDWNLFPVKEFKLGLAHETCGDVGYLEGVLFFEKENRYYITHHQSDPVLL